MAEIKDSGNRTEFASGAVRDIQEGKGRCDLLPLDTLIDCLKNAPDYADTLPTFRAISDFQKTGYPNDIIAALSSNNVLGSSWAAFFLEVAIHFEDGAKKYGERNWEKGIPCDRYIDSAIRHYLKYLRGDQDERHDRAFIWNLLCCHWTAVHHPELNPYGKDNT